MPSRPSPVRSALTTTGGTAAVGRVCRLTAGAGLEIGFAAIVRGFPKTVSSAPVATFAPGQPARLARLVPLQDPVRQIIVISVPVAVAQFDPLRTFAADG